MSLSLDWMPSHERLHPAGGEMLTVKELASHFKFCEETVRRRAKSWGGIVHVSGRGPRSRRRLTFAVAPA